MTDPDEADRRIAQLEIDLARAQTDSTYSQIEANLVRQRLRTTLNIAMSAIGRLASGFDTNVARMAGDLTGSGHDLAD